MDTLAPRGSDHLQERFEIDEAQLKKIAAIADGDRARIIDWWIYGQPAFDRLNATFQVKRGDVGRVVDQLLADGPRGRVELFPIGIPFPEEIVVHFKSGPR